MRERGGFKCNPNSNFIIQMNLKSRLASGYPSKKR